jgi:catechol 2,3-dioxygenase-like lactoylglutathione lyase family enzyme
MLGTPEAAAATERIGAFLKGHVQPPLTANLEVVVIPVSDVDRSTAFYTKLGWRLDADRTAGSDFRLVQFTPPGSSCSIQFGRGLTSAPAGSARGLYLTVSDIVAARERLLAGGAPVSEVFHEGAPGARFDPDAGTRLAGPAPDHASYRSFATFADPDGNVWIVQEVTHRLAGRVEPGETSFASSSDLASALRRAEAAHGAHERRIGHADANWPDWYAAYMVAERAGATLPV